VRLVDTGRGEKAPVRFRFTKGTRQTAVMETTTGVGASVPGGPMRMTFELTQEVTDVAADGTATLEGSSGAMTMTGGPSASTTADLGLEKLRTRLRLTMSARGEILTSEAKLDAEGVDPALRAALAGVEANVMESLSQAGVVWPEEPLGVGARWVYRRAMKASGLDTMVHVETTLVARDGDRLDLASRLRIDVGEQDLQPAGSPLKLHIRSMKGEGTLTQSVDLARPVVTLDSTIAMTVEMSFPEPVGGRTLPDQKLEMTVTQRLRAKD
jgi:hypothetical protein